MRQIIQVIVAIGLLATISYPVSCGHKNPIQIEIKTEPDQFPMAVWMYWSYEICDSLTGLTDTMQVYIFNSGVDSSGREIFFWSHASIDTIYQEFWSMVGDSLMRYDEITSPTPTEIFIFPLELNQSWCGPALYEDSSHVSDSGMLTTPAGEFESAFRIDRTWNRDFEGGRDSTSTWIVPGVGIAQVSQYKCWSDGQNLTVSKNQIWRLIYYNL